MHITGLPGLGCLLHHSGGVLARIVYGFSLAGSTHGEVYVTLSFDVYVTLTFDFAFS